MMVAQKFDPVMHRLKIEILRDVRALVASDLDAALCRNITNVTYQQKYSGCQAHAAGVELRPYISKALGNHTYLEQRVSERIGRKIERFGSKANRKKMTATRLAWIDWMIACYEEDLAGLKGSA